MSSAHVTICMSTYNGEKFISEQLDSFRNQTHENWSLVIHDDGSTDGTIDIIKNYSHVDQRIKLVSDDGHMGVKRAFLSLLKIEDSEYYAFSDQDDVWHSDKLAILLTDLQHRDSTVPTLIYSDFDEIDATGNDITDYSLDRHFQSDFKSFLHTNTVTGCTCLFNRSLRNLIVEHMDALNYDQMYMHDWWATLVASAFGTVLINRQRLVSYRQHGNNVVGAHTEPSFGGKLVRVLRLRNRYYIQEIQQQAALLLEVYGKQLSTEKRQNASTIGNMLTGWNPLKNWHALNAQGLLMKSWYYNAQIFLLMFTPEKARMSHLN